MKLSLQKNLVGEVIVGLLLLSVVTACRSQKVFEKQSSGATAQPIREAPMTVTTGVNTAIGFRTRRNLAEHYEKHGREFGSLSQAEYLRQAQTLRDAPISGDILEAKRSDGVTTRFDRKAGAFLAFNEDSTIRTFFKPNDGERYFKRQLKRS